MIFYSYDGYFNVRGLRVSDVPGNERRLPFWYEVLEMDQGREMLHFFVILIRC